MAEHQAQISHSLVLRGKLRTTVRWITERETGGVLQPGDRCTKTGDWVMEVLLSKHPEAWAPTTASSDSYPDHPPELAPVDIIDDTVTVVAGRLSGGAGPGETESVSLQHLILRFGAVSRELRMIVGDFTEWLGHGRPPWAAYRELLNGRMIVLDKQPGIRPVGVGETWRRLMAKGLLWVTGPEAKDACGTLQLAIGVEAGTEGAIHAMYFLWGEHSLEEDWGFLLIDARNAFNEEKWTAMLWAVRHKWPSGAQFTFNCYRQWATLVVREIGDGSGHLLHSKEGVTQGDPLDMIAYGIVPPPPSSGSFGDPAPASHNRGTRMMRGQRGSLNTS